MKIHKRLLSLILCAVLLICALPVNVFAAETEASDFPTVLAEAKKGVVQLYTLASDGRYLYSATGTGFAVGEAGTDANVFLTNQHVVTQEGKFAPENVRIWILQEDCEIDAHTGEPDPTRSITCEVLKTTTGYPDYAIIRATEDVTGYKPLPLLSSKSILDGQKIYVLGFPGDVEKISTSHSGIDDITATDGIVSKHMQLDGVGTWVLMHTAHTYGGNSGGPLITEEGAVVGLHTYSFTDTDEKTGEKVADTARYFAVYIDYAIDGLIDLGLPYEEFGAKVPTETTEATVSTEPPVTEPPVTEPPVEPEQKQLLPWIIGGGAALIAVVAAVVVILVLKKKKAKEAEQRRLADDERRRQKDEYRRREEKRRQVQEVKARLQLNGGTIYPIHASGCVIGRERDCDIVLPESTSGVSRRHCKLEFMGDKLILTDLNSTYGTYIHGKRIPANTPVALKPGSSFCLGSENCRFTVC